MLQNPYVSHIHNTLPRLLALFDMDRVSSSYGLGDRYFWAWGLIDFGNGTFQGAAHGLTLLWKSGLWPFPSNSSVFLTRIDALFKGASTLLRKDGSLEEAFPREGSFCVTALVAFDLLCTLNLLQKDIDREMEDRWISIVQPMIGFLTKYDETHGVISNHLATASAALVRWKDLTDDFLAEHKAEKLIQRILDHQDVEEGWFKEYEGADPGYQTLCTYYLADIHQRRHDWDLLGPLRKSIRFLWHFAHPDGSFGGVYGSRCTRFYNPAGIEALAHEIPEAHALAHFMAKSIAVNTVVTLSTIDEPNLVPWFNSYCWAAVLYEQRTPMPSDPILVPCRQGQSRRTCLRQAGLVIDQGPDHYTIVSTHKGGVTVHFRGQKLVNENVGIVVRNKSGALASTQSYTPENSVHWDGDILIVRADLSHMPKRLPRPYEFLVLRFLCVSGFQIRCLREWVKGMLVRLLITRKKRWPLSNTRRIKLESELTIHDECVLPDGYEMIENVGRFVAIHMASQGYWQIQDEENPP